MTLKQQLRDEFKKEWPGLTGRFETAEEEAYFYAFLDQAYDRIREETINEAGKAIAIHYILSPGKDDYEHERFVGINKAIDDASDTIQSLITKK